LEDSRGTGVDPSSEGGEWRAAAERCAAALSRLVMAITQGMAVQAKAGASRAQLREIGDAALAMLQ
jgi:hypothetical protein